MADPDKHSHTPKPGKPGFRYLPVVLAVLAGLALSSAACFFARDWESHRIRLEFEKAADRHISAIKRDLESVAMAMESLVAFYNQSYFVERREFHGFAKHLVASIPSIQALEWIPRVRAAKRAAYEEAARKQGFPEFQITERRAQGRMVRAGERREYFPVYYLEPFEGNELALGFDLASDEVRKKALYKSRDSGKMTVSGRITLVQETATQFGLLLYGPLYNPGADTNSVAGRRANLKGFALGVFRVGDMIERALSYVEPEGIDIIIKDLSAPEGESFLYYHRSRLTEETAAPPDIEQIERSTGYRASHKINIADRQWLVVCMPTPEFIASRKTWQPWVVLFSSLLIALILAVYLTSNIQKSVRLSEAYRELQLEIEERTRAEGELKKSRKEWEDIFQAVGHPTFILDREHRIVAANKAALRATGSSEGDLRGKKCYEMFHGPDANGPPKGCPMEEMLGSGRVEVAEMEVELLGGVYLVSCTPVLGERGQIEKVIHIATNITERKRAQEALEESRRTLHTLMSNLPGMAYRCRNDRDWTAEFVSDGCEDLTGYRPSQLVHNKSLSYNQVIHPDDREAVWSEVQAALKQDRPFELTYRIITAAGEEKWVWEQGRGIASPRGEIFFIEGFIIDISERIRSEEALRNSEVFLDSIIEKSPYAMWISDAQGTLIRLNQACRDLLNITDEEVAGRYNILRDNIVEAKGLMPLVREVYDEGRTVSFTIEYDSSQLEHLELGDTVSIILYVTISPVKDKNGNVTHAIVQHIDITARERAEKELKRESEKAQRYLDVAGVMMVVLGADQRVSLINKKGCDMLGYPEEEIVGKNWFDTFIPKWSREKVRAVFEKLIAGEIGSVEYFENAVLTSSGRERVVAWHNTILKDMEGNVTGTLSSGEDITERKLAEEALRDREQQYRLLVENVPAVIFKGYADWSVEFFDDKVEELTGFEKEEFNSKRKLWSDVILEEDLDRAKGVIINAFRRGDRSYLREYRIEQRNRDVLWVQERGHLFLDDNGRTDYISGVFFDITERRHSEEEKRSLESQLLHAQKMEAIGTLAGGIAHDFNNLLQAVTGYAEILLLDKHEDDPGYRELKEIFRAGRRGREMIQQLLAFSRKVESRLKPVELNHHVRQVTKLLARTIPKMIKIELRLAQDLWTTKVDPIQIEQVLMNLAVNAKDAMPDGGSLIISSENVTLKEEFGRIHLGALPGRYVLLSIEDTGHGIDKDSLEHIFDPFYSTKEVGKGTGLGLSMVYGIVRNHGGYIMCLSNPGKGTAFNIYLPAVEHMEEPGRGEEEAEDIAGGSETILLVDDEEYIRNLGTGTLARFGYTVLVAEDGESALEVYRHNRGKIDLVILDLIMPGMGGMRCLDELLEIDPGARVVIASGYAGEGHSEKEMGGKSRAFIRKPFQVREMLKAIREAIDAD